MENDYLFHGRTLCWKIETTHHWLTLDWDVTIMSKVFTWRLPSLEKCVCWDLKSRPTMSQMVVVLDYVVSQRYYQIFPDTVNYQHRRKRFLMIAQS
ncbi:hypothetical protein V6N13_117460 [Hibiscus sabdariffa]